MRVVKEGNLYHVHEVPFEYKDTFLRKGFAWDKTTKTWITPFASKLSFIVGSAATAGAEENRAASYALSTDAVFDLQLYDFQNAGVNYITSRKASLLADEPGAGKTAQAIVSCVVWGAKSILVVCPASLKINWKKEFRKFSSYAASIAEGSRFPSSPVVIINYDILHKFHDVIRAREWGVIICDEAHYLKGKSKRAAEVIGSRGLDVLKAKYKIAITGTPIVNRPIELFNILRFLCPQAFPNKHRYALRYCAAKAGVHGWDYSGASHLEELNGLLREAFMVRRFKKDVLPQLPAKIRQVIELDPDAATRRVLKTERALFGDLGEKDTLADEEYKQIILRLKFGTEEGSPIATVRRESGLAKTAMAIEHIKEALNEEEKIVVFAYHTEVISKLAEAFGDQCVVVQGCTSLYERDRAVERFQNDESCRVFVGNFIAAGVGITLTAASRVVFVESDWVPGNVEQAIDRLHRIGQRDTVCAQFLVVDGSIDALMAKTVVRKQEVLDAVLR